MEIKELIYNYRPDMSDGKEVFGETYALAVIGEKGVVKIDEHRAAGEGDKWYYGIHMDSGEITRTFAPYMVKFK